MRFREVVFGSLYVAFCVLHVGLKIEVKHVDLAMYLLLLLITSERCETTCFDVTCEKNITLLLGKTVSFQLPNFLSIGTDITTSWSSQHLVYLLHCYHK